MPLSLPVRRSRLLTAALCLAHAMAGIALAPTDLPTFVKLAIWLALAVSLTVSLFNAPPAELAIDQYGGMHIHERSGERVEASIASATIVLCWLIVLRLTTARGNRSLVLLPDNLERDGHRKLRVALRWQATVATG